MFFHSPTYLLAAAFFFCVFTSCNLQKTSDFSTWKTYRGDDGTNAYSSLTQINTKNVTQLQVAWVYRTGDLSDYFTLECNPIIIGNVLYGISPKLKTFALNAQTGEPLWVFDPFPKDSKEGGFNRGLAYWANGNEQRIIMFAGNRMIALDALSGKQILSFGDSGYVDLNKNLRPAGPGLYENVNNTSPAVIYEDLVITGSSVGEDYESSPGHIRAYDVRTGKMKWIFHTIPQPGEPGYDTWPKDAYKTAGGCNAWAGLSLDRKRGILFAATGSPSFDFHGGERLGQNLFGNSIIAIEAKTGKYIWHYQVTHHDLWDYDLPSPPNLVTIKKEGKVMDVVAQITKQGFIFILDRQTGKPVFPIEERPVAASTVPGEQSWPTQPVPLKPLPLCRQKLDENDITDISPEANAFVRSSIKNLIWGEMYLPPSLEGTVQIPGYRGGAEWSGACVDMPSGMMYVGINDIPNITTLVKKTGYAPAEAGKITIKEAGNTLYQKSCSVCHGADRKGNDGFPPLLGVEQRFKPSDVKTIIEKGKGMMPGFRDMSGQDKEAIVAYLFNTNDNRMYTPSQSSEIPTPKTNDKVRYSLKGYVQLLDQNGYPGIKPPWGTLNAVNLNTGELEWKIPLGQYPELVEKGRDDTGTQLFGGGIVTAGGLIFIGASQDEKFRAIDKSTGKILWEYQLPAGGYATPATYEVDGKQYVVIAAGGGGRQRTKTGDYYIAFALR